MVDPLHAPPASDGSPALAGREAVLRQFDHELIGGNSAVRFGAGWRDRREIRSIRRALARVPRGSHVLNLPCGAGPLLDILASCGYRVTCADCSEHMTRTARRRWEAIRARGEFDAFEPHFAVCDVMRTGYADGHFDAVVCNRLFQHFRESEVRIRALSELRRISRGPVIVSFFNAFALGAARFHLKHVLRRTIPLDRVPIPAWSFLNDVRRAGLTPVALHAAVWGISPLWHVVSIPTAGRSARVLPHRPLRKAEAG